jgi:hypothetical protein
MILSSLTTVTKHLQTINIYYLFLANILSLLNLNSMDKIKFVEGKLENFDAVIATGSYIQHVILNIILKINHPLLEK